MQKLIRRLKALPRPISKMCSRFQSSTVDEVDGAIRLLHQPWEGTESFAIWLFAPATKKNLNSYEKLHGISIHPAYRDALLVLNGFQAFGLDLFGLPFGMLKDPPVFDRSGTQCIDLATENREKFVYDVEPTMFHFGARHYSFEENCGYFLNEKGAIFSYLEGGRKIKHWRSWDRFLEHELAAAEELARSEFPKEWAKFDRAET